MSEIRLLPSNDKEQPNELVRDSFKNLANNGDFQIFCSKINLQYEYYDSIIDDLTGINLEKAVACRKLLRDILDYFWGNIDWSRSEDEED